MATPTTICEICATVIHMALNHLGFIFMAMASFMLFKLVIVMFTSIGGAAMILFGSITLLLHVEAWEPAVRAQFSSNQTLMPLLLAVAAVAGFVIQESRLKGEGGGQAQPKKS